MAVTEEKWEGIANEAIEEAESVRCDPQVFIRGLKQIETIIRERRQLAEEEFGDGDEDDDDEDRDGDEGFDFANDKE